MTYALGQQETLATTVIGRHRIIVLPVPAIVQRIIYRSIRIIQSIVIVNGKTVLIVRIQRLQDIPIEQIA